MKLLSTLFEVTVYSAVLFIAIMAFKTAFKKSLSPALQFAVWFLLIARLCLPFTIESGFHLFTAEQPAGVLPIQGALMGEPEHTLMQTAELTLPLAGWDQAPAESTVAADALDGAPAFTLSWSGALIVLWVCGMAFRAGKLLYTARKLRLAIAENGVAPDARTRHVYAQCLSALSIKRAPPLVMLQSIASPALTVGLRPVILLPYDVCRTLTEEGLSFTIRHELTHYQRGDSMLSMLLRLLEAVYWFNPVVWLMNREITRDMETACDSRATASFTKAERRAYALTLLGLFAQPARAAYVLGMALSAAEKDAARRVQGIFKERKSRPGVKLSAAALCAVLVMGCFTTACQPKPEVQPKPVVHQSDGAIRDAHGASPAHEASPVREVEYEVPAQYTAAPQSFYNDRIRVYGTMDVEAPKASGYSVYNVSDAPLTQAQVERLCAVLMQGRPLTNHDDTHTKEDIKRLYLLPAQQELARLEAGEEIVYDSGALTVEGVKKTIAMYQQWVENAPESKDDRPVSVGAYAQAEEFNVEAELGGPSPAVLWVSKSPERYYTFKFINGVEYIYNSAHAETGDLPIRTTRQEAIAIAEKLVRDIGFDDFALAAVCKTTKLGSEMDIISAEYQSAMAYCVVFTRVVDGLQTTYGATDSIGFEHGDRARTTWYYETLMVMVDDGGVANVIFKGNTERTDAVKANVSLMEFPGMMEQALKHLQADYAYIENQHVGEGVRTEGIEIELTGAKLGYMRVRAKDQGSCTLIPVWDLYGTRVYHYNESDVERLKKADSDFKGLESVQTYDSGYRPLLTVNALDGSAIDRSLGY